MWHPNWQTHVQTEIRQIAKPFDFPTVFSLFGHFLCKCRALPQTCAVRRKPFPYNNRTFANIAEPKKGLIMNTWQVQKKKWTPTFDDYRFTIHYLLRRIDDILISVFFYCFLMYYDDRCTWGILCHTLPPYIFTLAFQPLQQKTLPKCVELLVQFSKLNDSRAIQIGLCGDSVGSCESPNHGLTRSFSGK